LPDGWLCKLTIDDSESTKSQTTVGGTNSRRASDQGLLPITLDDYLKLLDASGRMLRDDKAGAIPTEFAPILERLGVRPAVWSQLVENYHDWFGHIVGSSEKIARRAAQVGRHWFRGQSHCAAAFG
jgi:hypothetical protein